tara:strand:- start:4419 stop:4691 length:273 start_codon:yes stop_codon:yes gene_type:complete
MVVPLLAIHLVATLSTVHLHRLVVNQYLRMTKCVQIGDLPLLIICIDKAFKLLAFQTQHGIPNILGQFLVVGNAILASQGNVLLLVDVTW